MRAAAAIGMLSLAVVGCQQVGEAGRNLQIVMDRAVGKMVQEGRGRGEKLLATADEVAALPTCQNRRLPHLSLEAAEVNPRIVKPGESFNFRFVYVLCPDRRKQPVTGELETSIFLHGEALHSDLVTEFDVKPGRWAVDNDIVVPSEASPGIYYVGVAFRGRRVRFEDQVRVEIF